MAEPHGVKDNYDYSHFNSDERGRSPVWLNDFNRAKWPINGGFGIIFQMFGLKIPLKSYSILQL